MVSQDNFIDDEDDSCPLCIEEFDLSDRNFKPCPCGYQVCQFCYNNIKNNMNGLCPACRRPYDDANIQYKSFSQEELVEFSKKIQKDRKKRAQDQRQKEVQKREAEKENRKSLVGVRVVQKNLVYVTGLTPTAREDELLKTLRKPEFFGQYGNILKISISNRKSTEGQNPSLGIYVTFERKEDASRCIQAVNNSTNGDRVLRAQLGTTKYCSAWLRHEQCQNKSCMFLHELGDEEDSYTRQDLSSMNMIKAQYTEQPPVSTAGPSRAAPRQQATTAPTASAPPPAPTASNPQTTARPSSRDGSELDADGSALPSSANWAKTSGRSRRGSYATSGAASSPAISTSLPVMTEVAHEAIEQSPIAEEPAPPPAAADRKTPRDSDGPASASSGSTRTPLDSAIKALLLDFKDCPDIFPNVPSTEEIMASYPPLFDVRGGEKRRLMREEEEARLDMEQEGSMEAPDMSDGEPEESGSLALGGEPEVRENARETHNFEPRRSGGQPPIQRGNEALLPAAMTMPFGQGSTGNLGTIGSRTMTPQQQQLFMRPQSGFNDNMPSGVALTQAALFQHQGHTRGGSRFSFANESSNSVSVKLAGNPRFSGQAAAMQSANFASQSSSQYYPSSIPGPPPGLKSTGTPPSLFGQGRSFGSAFNGPKEQENLHSLVHGRGGASQSHDAGKREFANSPFSNQYPTSTSSTPTPASGVSASLFGTHPGAFQDFGSKQRKKGKKHRHANTSSSGGSGLVDLADPSILQARMQQQSQSNAGVGQGVFGGQSQDDDTISLDDVETSIEALITDDPFGPTRTSRPSLPPGLDIPYTRVPQSQPPPALPALPEVAMPISAQKAMATSSQAPGLKPETTPKKKGADAKRAIKALAAESGLSTDISSQRQGNAKGPVLQDEDFPALGPAKGKEIAATAPSVPALPTPKVPTLPKAAEKRAAPAVLDIGAAVKPPEKLPENTSAIAKSTSSFPPLPTPTAATPASATTPAARAAPKTLRVVATPKTEAPPTVPSASVAASRRPETPASELVSDTASVVSASISASRTSSPPPVAAKVGSAPVRSTTKSQQRKQRKEAQKTTVIPEVAAAEPEEVAPILGRKKKQKKEKPANAGPSAQKEAEAPRPAIETTAKAPAAKAPAEKVQVEEKPVPKAKPAKNSKSAEATVKTADNTSKPKEPPTAPAQTVAPPMPPPPQPTSRPAPEEAGPTPASVFKHLLNKTQSVDPDKLAMLKPVPGLNYKHDIPASASTLPTLATAPLQTLLTPVDLKALVDGGSVRKTIDGTRVLFTPSGYAARNLTEEEEDKFLALQKLVGNRADDPASFTAPRHQQPAGGFSIMKGRAVDNGAPSYFPKGPVAKDRHRAGVDLIAKMHREDAIAYINQYVLSRVNLSNGPLAHPGHWNKPGKESATAIALNTVVPYIFGSDYAAGTAVYSAGTAVGYASNVAEDLSWMDQDALKAQDKAGSEKQDAASRVQARAEAYLAPGGAAAPGRRSDPDAALGPLGALGSMAPLSVEEAEKLYVAARKEADLVEKTLNQVIKRNRRTLLNLS